MKYEFTFFDNIVATKPNPIVHNQEPKEYYLNYLIEKFDNIEGIHTVTLKKTKSNYSLLSNSFETSLHRFADDSYLVQETLFDQHDKQAVDFALKKLEINFDNVIAYSTTFCSEKVRVKIKVNHSFEKLTEPEAKYFYYFYNIKSEIDRIKSTIKESVFAFKNEHETEHFVQKCQNEVQSLCFQLLKLFPEGVKKCIYEKPTTFDDEEILHFVLASLENIALFIEQYYLRHLNEEACIPYRSGKMNHSVLKEKINTVANGLLISNLHPKLLNILQSHLDRFRKYNLEEQITYKEFNYFNLFIDEFYELFNSTQEINEEIITEMLAHLNFNSLKLYNYRAEKIKSEINSIEDYDEKIKMFLHYLKIHNQIPNKSNMAFNPVWPSINIQISNWIEEEMNCLLKQNSLTQLKQTDISSDKKVNTKISTSLSVAQLCLLFKLMSDTGIINHPNQKDIFRFIADNFQTENANNISVSSISTKYYNVDLNTIEKLKDCLIKMLSELNQKV